MPQIEQLIKSCKHLLVDLDLDRPGSHAVILPRLSEQIGKPVHKNSLGNALTGFRTGPSSVELLEALHDILENWPSKAA
jgi:hypothetical protein